MSPPRPLLALAIVGVLHVLAACGDAAKLEPADRGCTDPVAPVTLTGPGQSGVTCPSGGTALRFAGGTPTDFGQSFMSTYCNRCHATTVAGAARNDAPIGANFDDLCSIRERIRLIDQRAGAVGVRAVLAMPPPPPAPQGPEPTDEQRAQLSEWLSCGAP